MMPFALVRYAPQIRKRQFATLYKNRSIQSLAVLVALSLPQLYVIHKDGIPKLPGYMDHPFNPARTIEIFVSRSYTYAVLFPFNKFLRDPLVIVAIIGFAASSYLLPKKQKVIFAFGFISIFITSALFVVKRTGVSDFFSGYTSGGPDQFFFAQNWICTFILSLVIVAAIARLKSHNYRLAAYGVILLLVLGILAPRASSYGRNHFEQHTVGTIYQNALVACDKPGSTINLVIYPATNQIFSGIPRQALCARAVLHHNQDTQ
jgi:hypothetical protein